MMKPRWSADVNLGHVLVALSMLVSAAVWAFGLSNDIALIDERAKRNERCIEKLEIISSQLGVNQAVVAKNLEVLTALFQDHIRRTEK